MIIERHIKEKALNLIVTCDEVGHDDEGET